MEPEKRTGYARNHDDFRTIAQRRRDRIVALQAQLEYIDGVPIHPDPPKGHGSSSAYNTAGCRCEVCKAGAHEEWLRTVERRKKVKPKPPVLGTTVNLDSVFNYAGPETTRGSGG